MTLFLLVFELIVFRTSYGAYFENALSAQLVWLPARVGGLLATVALQVLFFRASFIASRPWRVAYVALFTAIVATQYGFVRATGGFINGHDFRIAAGELSRWGAMGVNYASWLAVVPAAIYGVLLVRAPRLPSQGDFRRFAGLLCLTAGLHSIYAANLYARDDEDSGLVADSGPPTTSLQWFARSATMASWSWAASRYWRARLGEREAVTIDAPAIPARHLMLVVDESVRADHMSINGYPRQTTPWLEALQHSGGLTNWGVAASTASTSNTSVICLLTGVNTLPDRQRRALTQPTIFQYAKAMGFRTHLFDGGARYPRFGLSSDDLRFVDDWATRDRFGAEVDADFRIAVEAGRLLEQPAPQFIVVLKRGGHAPYQQNYPPDRAVWLPDLNAFEAETEDRATVNSYDNGIVYNVDTFFQTLFRSSQGIERTVIIYTSDHGQLLTDSKPQLTRDLVWGEVAVPLMMLGGARPDVDVTYRASHANVMATLLDLMGVPADSRRAGYARSLLDGTGTTVEPRRVFVGAFFGIGAFAIQDFDELRQQYVSGAP
jgi:glucan phosphoethanolaminetransferase (alkaline phosphatase superfamily)